MTLCATLAALGVALISFQALAQEQTPDMPADVVVMKRPMLCRDIEPLLANLNKQYEEMPVASANSADDGYFLTMTRQKDDKGTFTILIITPGGKACVLGAGSDWHWLPSAASSTKD